MPPIHNHYVPAYYLSGFTNPTTGRIFMYFKPAKKVVTTTVQAVANELHYWSDETEQHLANEVENPATIVFEKVKSLAPTTVQDRWVLSRYMVSMLKRVPEGRNRVLSYGPSLLREGIEQIKLQLEAARENNPSKENIIDRRLKEIETLPSDFFEKVPQQAWEQVISPEMTIESVHAIHQMRWTFFISGENRGFITSDNPVVFTRAIGVRPPAGELFFPISQNILLYCSWNKEMPEDYVRAQRSLIDQFNYWMVASATEYIFYSGHKNWIEALIKKVTKKERKITSTQDEQQ